MELGQTSLIVTTFLIGLLISKSFKVKMLFFSFAAVLKYSMLPFFAPMLLFKKKVKLCFCAFMMFVIWLIVPAIFGQDLWQLYLNYFMNLFSQTSEGGFNTYSGHGFHIVSMDFIKLTWFNSILKASLILLFLYGLFLDRKSKQISLELLFMAASMTMVISYHRIYDMVFPLVVLLVLLSVYLVNGRIFDSIIIGAFAFYFVIPRSFVFWISGQIGKTIGENPLLIIDIGKWPRGISHNFFPLTSIVCLLMALYSFWLFYKSKKGTAVFGKSNCITENIFYL